MEIVRGCQGDLLPIGDRLPYVSIAKLVVARRELEGHAEGNGQTHRNALISPQTVCSLAVSPISMKYLHNCV